MKKVAGRLKLDLAQFRDLEAFAQFGSELDPATQAQLARGQRLVATLNQRQYDPYTVGEQVAVIWSTTNGYVDDIPVTEVGRFNDGLRRHLASERTVLDAIAQSNDLSDDTAAALKRSVEEFKSTFQVEVGDRPNDADAAQAQRTPADAVPDETGGAGDGRRVAAVS
jgi:F-type H+-transporting ATPase subunit alpha